MESFEFGVIIPSFTYIHTNMGGATILKVGGGDNFAIEVSQKKFLTPHFLASGGDKILLR